ncbi:MAG: mandelate racemase/muconate lactonizing enzyme family protein [Chloroflexota bacterium]
MKITDVKVHLVDLGREYHLPLHGSFRADAGVVRVFTDEGIEGNADFCTWAVPARVLGQLIIALKPQLVGQDPRNIEGIWNRTFKTTRSVVPIYAPGCINVALWDILGKALKTPIYRLLGGGPERVPAYASTQSCEDVASFIKLSLSLVEQGWTVVKLHGFGEPGKDIELCRAVRKAVGDKIDLMVDPLGLYDRAGAMRVGRVLDELGFYWYEEPLPESDVDGYIELCHALDTPVLGVDSLRLTLGHYADYIARGALDIVQADAARQGISWCRKVAAIAEGFGRRFQAHGYGTPLHLAANLHLMASLPNTDFLEIPVPVGLVDTPMKDTITPEAGGWVKVPQKPGLGLEIDWERMNKATTAVLE